MSGARPRLPLPCIMLVTDGRAHDGRRLDDTVEAAIEGGVNVVQVRDKERPGGELYTVVERLVRLVRRRALVMVNERLDVALAAGADGVQLGGSALPTEAARRLAPDLLIGRAVHDSTCAGEASARGADLLLVGTIFASRSHPEISPAGPSLLRKVAATTHLPLVGIGGVTASNAAQVIGAGASGVAVVSEIVDAREPREATAKLVATVRAAWPTAPLHKRH